MRGASAGALAALTEKLGSSDTLAETGQTGAELFGAAAVLRSEPALRRIATDVTVPGEVKADLVTGIFDKSVGRRTLSVLTEAVQRRWTLSRDLPDVLDQLAVVATVRSAGAQGGNVGDELFEVRQLLDANPELRTALSDDSRSAEDRTALVHRLFGDQLLPASLRLLEQAVAGPHRTVDTALAAYQKLAADARGELIATVHSARELSSEEQDRLVRALSTQYDAEVHLHLVVDPALVGGLRVEVGDDVIDGTVSSRLDDAHRKLAG